MDTGSAPLAPYAVEYRSGERVIHGSGSPAFTISAANQSRLRRFLKSDAYSAGRAFIRGELDVSGDLIAALRLKKSYPPSGLLHVLWTAAARFSPARLETWLQSRNRAARNIRFHYDVSNEFYRQFLDERMVYSEAYFRDPNWSLEKAQEEKLDKICRDLELHSGERFLDVGCGWGALLLRAVEGYGAQATGCTLSRQQYQFVVSLLEERGLQNRVRVRETDYRNISERFDKIASIGMFEHVGRHRLCQYFRSVYGLLESGGRFVNSGIIRPESSSDDPETRFLLKRVFPGGELAHLTDVIREAEGAGFAILRVESMRLHYGRTCREWVNRLREKADRCIQLVGAEVYRTWLLYLAASAVSFESGETDVFAILMTKPP